MIDVPYPSRIRRWIASAPQEHISTIMIRCVLRTLPGCIESSDYNSDHDIQTLLRATLATTMAVKNGEPLIVDGRAAIQVQEVDYNTGQHTSNYGDFRRVLVNMLSLSILKPPYDTEKILQTIHSAGNVLDSFDSGVSAFVYQAKHIDFDIEKINEMNFSEHDFPLFAYDKPLPNMERGISKLLHKLQDPIFPSFWHDWYNGFLVGRPVNWDLQGRVALLPDDEWGRESIYIASRIEELCTFTLSEKLPLAETVSFDEAIIKFRSVPVPVGKSDLLAATLSQLEDALNDAVVNPSNGLNERSREVRVLRRTLAKYGNDPQRIEMDCTSIHTAITRRIISDELPPSEENIALQIALEEGALAIRATHSEIAENRNILRAQRLAELTVEDKEILRNILPILVEISDERLANDFSEDIGHLTQNPSPDNSTAPSVAGSDMGRTIVDYGEKVRTFGRVARIGIFLRRFPFAVQAIESNPMYRTTNIINNIVSLIKMGLALF